MVSCLAFTIIAASSVYLVLIPSISHIRYTPYFFDKNMLDNILEESVDQHFHALIQTRHMQRRRDVIDDNLAAEVVEEIGDSIWEPPEVKLLFSLWMLKGRDDNKFSFGN